MLAHIEETLEKVHIILSICKGNLDTASVGKKALVRHILNTVSPYLQPAAEKLTICAFVGKRGACRPEFGIADS